MVNLKESFEEAARARGDVLLTAVVGSAYDKCWDDDQPKIFQPQSWSEASKTINYRYDSGYGSADCHAVVAWGERFVYYVHEYDGATGICSMPRNPEPCVPSYEGSE